MSPDFHGYLDNSPGIDLACARWPCEETGAMCIATETIALKVLTWDAPMPSYAVPLRG